MATLHLIPHTHWDREWYEPFQVFRTRLVHLVDFLLDLLERDTDYAFFTLDGQVVVLEDYLAIRPHEIRRIETHVRTGRLLIGPWYVLPDEFLVHPESLIRNLMRGKSICSRFGARMPVGYLPDPFGHIGQMPQILAGFGIDTAALRRGLSDEPCELCWRSPDGSEACLAYLRDGYENAARLPTDQTNFERTIRDLRDRLQPFCASSHILLMNGTDHQEPQAEIPRLLATADLDGDWLEISSLPAYFSALRKEIDERGLELPLVEGELRDPKRHHLLAGVLSSRVRIKRQNDQCETALLKFAEPLCAFAQPIERPSDDRTVWTGHLAALAVRRPMDLLQEAWRLLMLCHPHDSICGCSVDQVHKEMETRFDQVLQITHQITRQSMGIIAAQVDSQSAAPPEARASVIVFNPTPTPITGRVVCSYELPAGLDPFQILSPDGTPVPYRTVGSKRRSLPDLELDRDGLMGLLATVQDGRILGLSIQSVAILSGPDRTTIDVVLAQDAPPNREAAAAGLARIEALLENQSIDRFRAFAHFATEITFEMLASGVPGLGYKTYALVPAGQKPEQGQIRAGDTIGIGDFELRTDARGRFSLTQLGTGSRFEGLLAFHDGAEAGDGYTHSPIENDHPITSPKGSAITERLSDPLGEELHVQMRYELPSGIDPDRAARSAARTTMPMEIRARLAAGVPRVDFELRLDNMAEDHRLQLLFPLGAEVSHAYYGGHFEIVKSPTTPRQGGPDWVEQPAPERPMLGFVAAQRKNDGAGLMIACKGLREASVSPRGEIAITLLRCFGWLSRDDLATRNGDAGPSLRVPGGQSLGEHLFEFSLIPFQGDLYSARLQAEAFLSAMIAAGTSLHAGPLPHSASLLEVGPTDQFAITSIKEAEQGEGIIVRGVNLGDHPLTVTLRSLWPLRSARRTRLDEVDLEPCEVSEGGLEFQAGPHEIVTLRLIFEP